MAIMDTTEDYLEKEYTIEEYIALEEVSKMKHEYRRAKVYPISGGTINHGIIGGNIFAAFKGKTKKTNKDWISIFL